MLLSLTSLSSVFETLLLKLDLVKPSYLTFEPLGGIKTVRCELLSYAFLKWSTELLVAFGYSYCVGAPLTAHLRQTGKNLKFEKFSVIFDGRLIDWILLNWTSSSLTWPGCGNAVSQLLSNPLVPFCALHNHVLTAWSVPGGTSWKYEVHGLKLNVFLVTALRSRFYRRKFVCRNVNCLGTYALNQKDCPLGRSGWRNGSYTSVVWVEGSGSQGVCFLWLQITLVSKILELREWSLTHGRHRRYFAKNHH